MKKQVKFTIKVQCKVEQRSYEMLDGDPRVSTSWITEALPVLSYVDHQIECVTKTVNARVDKYRVKSVAICHHPVATIKADTTFHEITCELPIIYCLAENVTQLEQALDFAVKRVAEHVYVDGDFTLLDTIQLALEKEINEVFFNLWGNDVNVVRAQVDGSEWLSVRLFSKSEDSLLAFWIPENSVVVD
ncbi:hypothetical protein [Brevibacillus sp. 179-C9.3 HS]|uniref:hypothetical protein n=1 Tax=unclassified Brevibacillus TaxID=2684853 RepID=UPI0039A08DAD